MRIDRITMYRVCNPIKNPYTTSFGTQNAFNSIVVKMESGGLVGWGESCPWGCPAFSPYWDKGCFLLGKDFIVPSILHKEISTPQELQKIMEPIRGNEFAKAAFDVAFWDLLSRKQGISLKKAIGGTKEKAEVGYCFGVLKTFDDLIAGIDKILKMGYPRIKLKFCPGWECDMLEAVRSVYPDTVFHIDCNSAYTLADLPMLKKLDKYNLAMIEQPLMHDDILDHAKLQKMIDTPICLDESICSLQNARQAVEIGACKYINIKYCRVGGITPSLAIHDLCGEKNIGCWLGGMGESSLGTNVVANLATLPYVNYPSDISPVEKFYVENLGTPVLLTEQYGTYTLRDNPGLDVVANEDVLAKYKQEEAVFRMKSIAELKKFVIDRIESRKDEIISFGTDLLNNPESGYCEVKTAAKVKAELERLGLSCRTGLAVTGIRADIKCGKGDGPRIALMGELDALPVPSHPFADPVTGAAHACGHHAQLTQMLAAAEALLPIVDELSGSLAFIAVPAEEFQALDYCRKLISEEKIRYCGGKPEFIRLGLLDDIDAVLLIHAGHDTFTPESYNGFCMKEIVFEGKAAHGGLRPWAGINAASMARQALNMIDAQRDTFDDKDSVRIHGIISDGGDAVNVVPARAVLELQIRAKTPAAVANACKVVDRSVKAAAMAFCGKVTIHNLGGYMPYVSCGKLNKVHADNLMELSGKVLGNFGHRGSSTDMGDVSMLMPALHAYSGGFAGSPHGADFVVDDPVLAYVEGAKLLAMDVITLLGDDAVKGKEIAAEKPVMDKKTYLEYKESMSSKEEFKYDQA